MNKKLSRNESLSLTSSKFMLSAALANIDLNTNVIFSPFFAVKTPYK